MSKQRKTPKAKMTESGRNEWGKTYTVYTWDTEHGIYRELVTNQLYHQARAAVKESNEGK